MQFGKTLVVNVQLIGRSLSRENNLGIKLKRKIVSVFLLTLGEYYILFTKTRAFRVEADCSFNFHKVSASF